MIKNLPHNPQEIIGWNLPTNEQPLKELDARSFDSSGVVYVLPQVGVVQIVGHTHAAHVCAVTCQQKTLSLGWNVLLPILVAAVKGKVCLWCFGPQDVCGFDDENGY
jgi:hypothetical protein